MNVVTKWIILVTISFLSLGSHANETKESVDEKAAEFHSFFIYQLKKKGTPCLLQASITIQSMDEAHRSFMSGNVFDAILKSIILMEKSEIISRQYDTCPFYFIARRNMAALYMRYYYDNYQTDPDFPVEPNSNIPQPVSQRTHEVITTLFDLAYRKMAPYCNQNKCTEANNKILELSKIVSEDVNNKLTSYELLSSLMRIKKEIASSFMNTDFDLWNQVMRWINEKIMDMMYMVKPSLYPNEDMTIFNKYLLKTISYMMEEKDISSLCPIILYDFSQPMHHQNLSVNTYGNVLKMIQSLGQIFDVQYYANFTGNRYHNCKMTSNESVKFVMDFSREVKQEIKKISNLQ